MNEALHALNRFGLGARPGEARRLGDPREWVLTQLESDAPRASSSEEAAADALRDLRAAQAAGDRDGLARARARLGAGVAASMTAALERRLGTDTPVLERLTAFWSNHLCVSGAGKLPVAVLAGSYEGEAIRPHVLGRFEEMVLASATHPAMLLYLDNAQSIGPSSRAARALRRPRAGAARGLNENHARELLELHTLGVEGGYTQQDVQELARMLTGWTVAGVPGARGSNPDGPPRFTFDARRHEPGGKVLLGVRYAEAGVEEGRDAIRALCRHPSTAQFVAGRLARHFISDDPPASAVAAVARAFSGSGGDLRVTMRALVAQPEAWSAAHRKFRSPQDWVVAVLRALRVERAGALPAWLRQLRHPLWSPPAPKGFGDAMADWADPDSLLNRAELARTIARRAARNAEPRELAALAGVPATDPLQAMISDTSVPLDERVALVLAAPAFQWR